MANIYMSGVSRVTLSPWSRQSSPFNPESLLNWVQSINFELKSGEIVSIGAIADLDTSAELEQAHQARLSAERAQLEIQYLANEQAQDLAA